MNAEGSRQSYLHGINQIIQGGSRKPLAANIRCLQKDSMPNLPKVKNIDM